MSVDEAFRKLAERRLIVVPAPGARAGAALPLPSAAFSSAAPVASSIATATMDGPGQSPDSPREPSGQTTVVPPSSAPAGTDPHDRPFRMAPSPEPEPDDNRSASRLLPDELASLLTKATAPSASSDTVLFQSPISDTLLMRTMGDPFASAPEELAGDDDASVPVPAFMRKAAGEGAGATTIVDMLNTPGGFDNLSASRMLPADLIENFRKAEAPYHPHPGDETGSARTGPGSAPRGGESNGGTPVNGGAAASPRGAAAANDGGGDDGASEIKPSTPSTGAFPPPVIPPELLEAPSDPDDPSAVGPSAELVDQTDAAASRIDLADPLAAMDIDASFGPPRPTSHNPDEASIVSGGTGMWSFLVPTGALSPVDSEPTPDSTDESRNEDAKPTPQAREETAVNETTDHPDPSPNPRATPASPPGVAGFDAASRNPEVNEIPDAWQGDVTQDEFDIRSLSRPSSEEDPASVLPPDPEPAASGAAPESATPSAVGPPAKTFGATSFNSLLTVVPGSVPDTSLEGDAIDAFFASLTNPPANPVAEAPKIPPTPKPTPTSVPAPLLAATPDDIDKNENDDTGKTAPPTGAVPVTGPVPAKGETSADLSALFPELFDADGQVKLPPAGSTWGGTPLCETEPAAMPGASASSSAPLSAPAPVPAPEPPSKTPSGELPPPESGLTEAELNQLFRAADQADGFPERRHVPTNEWDPYLDPLLKDASPDSATDSFALPREPGTGGFAGVAAPLPDEVERILKQSETGVLDRAPGLATESPPATASAAPPSETEALWLNAAANTREPASETDTAIPPTHPEISEGALSPDSDITRHFISSARSGEAPPRGVPLREDDTATRAAAMTVSTRDLLDGHTSTSISAVGIEPDFYNADTAVPAGWSVPPPEVQGEARAKPEPDGQQTEESVPVTVRIPPAFDSAPVMPTTFLANDPQAPESSAGKDASSSSSSSRRARPIPDAGDLRAMSPASSRRRTRPVPAPDALLREILDAQQNGHHNHHGHAPEQAGEGGVRLSDFRVDTRAFLDPTSEHGEAEAPPDDNEPVAYHRIQQVDRLGYLPIPDQGPLADAFRLLRARLLGATVQQPSVMLVGGERRVGRTEIACQLALSLARRPDSRIVLVDGDFRRPGVAQRLGLPVRTFGVADLLRGSCRLEDALVYCREDNLFILPARPPDQDGDDLPDGRNVARLMHALHARFDYTVVDAGVARLDSGPLLLAPSAGCVALVARAGRSRPRRLRRAVTTLEQAGAVVAGVVLTGA